MADQHQWSFGIEILTDRNSGFYEMFLCPRLVVGPAFPGDGAMARQTNTNHFAVFMKVLPMKESIYRIEAMPHEKLARAATGSHNMNFLGTVRGKDLNYALFFHSLCL